MNREQRRDLMKQGASKDTVERLGAYNSPCTIVEATQISRGVAEDVVMDYDTHTRPLQVALSLQVEILKKIVIDAGLITDEEFKSRYLKEAQAFNDRQKSMLEPQESPKMEVTASDVDLKIVE